MADTRKESDGEWKTLRVPVIVEARLHNAMPETDISTLERNVDGLIAKQPNIGDGDLPYDKVQPRSKRERTSNELLTFSCRNFTIHS